MNALARSKISTNSLDDIWKDIYISFLPGENKKTNRSLIKSLNNIEAAVLMYLIFLSIVKFPYENRHCSP